MKKVLNKILRLCFDTKTKKTYEGFNYKNVVQEPVFSNSTYEAAKPKILNDNIKHNIS